MMKKVEYEKLMDEVEEKVSKLVADITNEEFAPYSHEAKEGIINALFTARTYIDFTRSAFIEHCDLLVDMEEIGEKVVELED